GGTAPYSYVWNPTGGNAATANGLGAGTYTITINDNNGCSAGFLYLTITQPSAISVTMSSTASTGNNGTATASVSGGTPGYSYSWSDASSQVTATATGLSAGLYTVNVTDSHGCTASDTITVPTSGGCATPVMPTICYVSVDTASNHNVVYWDTVGLATFNVQSFN